MIGKVIKKYKAYIHQKLNPIDYARSIGVTVGERCIIESFNFGSEPYLISMGNHVEITTGVQFITHDGATWVIRDDPEYQKVIRYGKITIHNNVFVGHGVIVLPNTEIGNNVIIGAGSVVKDNIPDNSVYAGVPAKYICSIKEYAEKCLFETPDYDKENYTTNKRDELLRILGKKQ